MTTCDGKGQEDGSMILGITGTREGITSGQSKALVTWLSDVGTIVDALHHGACVGADADVVAMFREYRPRATIEAHPSTLSGMVSQLALDTSDVVHPAAPPLERNGHIVRAVELLLAFPNSTREMKKGGTWDTYRKAMKAGCRVLIFWPNGAVTTGYQKTMPELGRRIEV